MMKVALTAVLALGLAACGGDKTANNAAETNAENAAMTDVNAANNDTTANLGFQAKLWAAVDALRNNMAAAAARSPMRG